MVCDDHKHDVVKVSRADAEIRRHGQSEREFSPRVVGATAATAGIANVQTDPLRFGFGNSRKCHSGVYNPLGLPSIGFHWKAPQAEFIDLRR
jgi:hypothetical protein